MWKHNSSCVLRICAANAASQHGKRFREKHPGAHNAVVTAKTKIVLVDDHRMFREGLGMMLNRQAGFSVVGEAGDGRGALASVAEASPDVVVLDFHLPDENGLQIADRLIVDHPSSRIIMLSGDTNETVVNKAVTIGVAGFLSKEEAMLELVQAIRAVTEGKVYLSPIAATCLANHLKTRHEIDKPQPGPAFSCRELEVLKLVAEGLRNKEIADRLGIGVKSVESYRARVMTKAGCSSPADLVRFAIKAALVQP